MKNTAKVVAGVVLMALVSSVLAAEFQWDPVTDSRVKKYQLHYGDQPGKYTQHRDVTATRITINDLPPGKKLYFAVRACDATSTDCSSFSNEVAFTQPEPTPVVETVAEPIQPPLSRPMRFRVEGVVTLTPLPEESDVSDFPEEQYEVEIEEMDYEPID